MHRFTRWVVRRCQDTLAGRGAKDPGRSFSRALLRAFPGLPVMSQPAVWGKNATYTRQRPGEAELRADAASARSAAPFPPWAVVLPIHRRKPAMLPGLPSNVWCGARSSGSATGGIDPWPDNPCASDQTKRSAGPSVRLHLRRLTYQLRAQAPSREGAESDVAPIRARSVEGRASCSAREASSSCSRASRPALASRLSRRTLVRLAKARRRTAGPDPACPSVHHFLPAGQIRPDGTTLLDGPGARVQLRILIWLPVLLASARSRTLRTTLNGPRTKAGPDTRRAHVVGPNIT